MSNVKSLPALGPMSTTEPDDVITVVNKFTVTGSTEQFEEAFGRAAEYMTRQPGCIDFTLLRFAAADDFYMNIAHWRNDACHRAAAAGPEFQPLAVAVRDQASSDFNVLVPVRAPRPTAD